jgi:diguanylate cyclase (GGDEF)-like protein
VTTERRPVAAISALSTLMAVVAIVALQSLPDRHEALMPSGWWMIVIIAVAYTIAERTVFHFEFRREAISASISEIPLVLCLVYLAPWPAVAARMVGSLLIIVLQWRSPLHKLAFNAALFMLEIAVAFTIMRTITGHFGTSHATILLAAALSAAVPTLIDAVLVSAAISLVEGGFRERVFYELKLFSWIAPLNSMAAAALLAPAMLSPWLIAVSVVPIVAMWGLMRVHGTLEQRYRDLDELHTFVRRVGPSLDLDELAGTAASESAGRLRARRVGMVIYDEAVGLRRSDVGTPLPELPLSSDDPYWASVFSDGTARLLTVRDLHKLGLVELSHVGEVLVAPITDGAMSLGLLALAEREGAEARFQEADVARLATMADQLAPSLRKAMFHERIEFEARHDGLTGLPNRTSFERLVETAIAHRSSVNSNSDADVDDKDVDEFDIVLMMDLDRFKEVNDTLGHHAGDALLVAFADRLRSVLAPGDVLARLAGDEFAVLARRGVDTMHQLSAMLVNEARRPFAIDGLEVVVTMSVGVAPMLGDVTDASTMLRRADIAMYAAKNQHTGYEMYRDEIDRRTPGRLSMLGDLRAALEHHDLTVHLQPKLDLATGVVIGVEALARWAHHQRGFVSPEDFVPVAEETGLIKQLTDLVLESSIEQIARLRQHGHHLGLAVNLSTHDLLDELLADRVLRRLDQYDVDPSMLTLEITESSLLIDAPRSRNTIDRLNRAGIRLSVDDFGIGYSSLSYLRRLPVSELKIDRSFVANLLLEDQDEVIVKSIIDLGHNLGLQVVAEGVETDEIMNRLRAFGCDVAQGFGICRPVPFDQFLTWLNTTGHPSRRRDPMAPGQWLVDGPAPSEIIVRTDDRQLD